MSFGVAAAPGRSTTAAATSSPSVGWGTAKVMASATAGCSSSTSSTSRGAIFSPPRLMISLAAADEKQIAVIVEKTQVPGLEPTAREGGLGSPLGRRRSPP